MIRCILAATAAWLFAGAAPLYAGSAHPAWYGYAGNAQHTAPAPVKGAPLSHIHWHTPVDLNPQYDGNELFIHYASPMFSSTNTLFLPVKTGATQGFQLEAHNGASGALLWTLPTDFVLPPNDWTPSFPAQITNKHRAYIAAAGGTVLQRGDLASANGPSKRLAFYGIKVFNANVTNMTTNVMIDTPITSDAAGNIYFGFVVVGSNAAHLQSGIARIGANGAGRWVGAGEAAGDNTITQVAMNCAPAISSDGSTLYITVSNGFTGDLLALDATTLVTKNVAKLNDPGSGQPAWIADISTASPTIGPDGDVYYGVLENPFPNHNDRGWLLHFDQTLATVKTPGSFGWDDTTSVVPASAVPSYKGTSKYLLMTKYNNYIGVNTGDGENKIAILDPNGTQQDEYYATPVTVMKEVQTLLGPHQSPDGGVYEWCINTAVVDALGGAVFAGSEDGWFYRWNLATNTITQMLDLNPPTPEAYTPSVVGPDGTVYAINNATLYAIGK
jgi:hypothetical protein